MVATLDNFGEAIALLGREKIDLVLTDVRLTGERTGIDLARAAKDHGIPVLFSTGLKLPEEAAAVALGCLSKPYSERQLRDALDSVDRVLAGRNGQAEEGPGVLLAPTAPEKRRANPLFSGAGAANHWTNSLEGLLMSATVADEPRGWRSALPAGVRPIPKRRRSRPCSSASRRGFPYAMIGATLTTRLKQDGIDKATITAFTLVFLVYNLNSCGPGSSTASGSPSSAASASACRGCWSPACWSWRRSPTSLLWIRREHRRGCYCGDPVASPAPASTSSSTPTGSNSGAAPARRRLRHEQYGWRIGSAGGRPGAGRRAARLDAPISACAAFALAGNADRADHGRASRHREPPGQGAAGTVGRSGGRSSSFSSARVRCSCCSSSCCTRSATRSPT